MLILTQLMVLAARERHKYGNRDCISHSSLGVRHGEVIADIFVSRLTSPRTTSPSLIPAGLNLIGFVWTVDQDIHHTVTVEFYDQEVHRNFHFTDPYLYDKACLSKIWQDQRLVLTLTVVDENGTLFSCPPANGNPATIFYRPHETWTSRADWRTQLPAGEDMTCKLNSLDFGNYADAFKLYHLVIPT